MSDGSADGTPELGSAWHAARSSENHKYNVHRQVNALRDH